MVFLALQYPLFCVELIYMQQALPPAF